VRPLTRPAAPVDLSALRALRVLASLPPHPRRRRALARWWSSRGEVWFAEPTLARALGDGPAPAPPPAIQENAGTAPTLYFIPLAMRYHSGMMSLVAIGIVGTVIVVWATFFVSARTLGFLWGVSPPPRPRLTRAEVSSILLLAGGSCAIAVYGLVSRGALARVGWLTALLLTAIVTLNILRMKFSYAVYGDVLVTVGRSVLSLALFWCAFLCYDAGQGTSGSSVSMQTLGGTHIDLNLERGMSGFFSLALFLLSLFGAAMGIGAVPPKE
jgi:hypothetical protein